MLLLFWSGGLPVDLQTGTGSAPGVSTVDGVGNYAPSIGAGAFSAAGRGLALGVGISVNEIIGSASGFGDAIAIGKASTIFGVTGVQALGVVGGVTVWGTIMSVEPCRPPSSEVWIEIVPKKLW